MRLGEERLLQRPSEDHRSRKPFTIVMPPPNVTGQLHMGHAMDSTLQDILIRFKRMQGLRRAVGARHRPRGHRHPDQGGGGAAHQGGTDPLRPGPGEVPGAGVGLEAPVRRARIVQQQKKLGASCDWDRARFTMDEGCSKAVRGDLLRAV